MVVARPLIFSSRPANATEALRAYTTLGAFAGREEKIKGSLEPGKLADVAVLDRDFFTIPADEIRDVCVDMTIVGGVVRYQRGSHLEPGLVLGLEAMAGKVRARLE